MTLLVAVSFLALAWADGGFYPRLIGAATVAVWWTVAIVIVFRLRAHPRIPPIALAAGFCLGGLAALSALSLLWASDDGGAFIEAVRMAGYAGLFALVLVTSPVGSTRPWLDGLALGLLGLAGLALLSRLHPSLTGEDEALVSMLPTAAGRLSWPIQYWNGLGACMALAIVLLPWYGARAESRVTRALATAAAPVPALALYFTSSRGSAIAAAIGAGVLLAADPGRVRLLARMLVAAVPSGLAILIASGKQELVDGTESLSAATQGDQMTLILLALCGLTLALAYFADDWLARVSLPRLGRRTAIALGAAALVAAVLLTDPIDRWEEFKEPPTREVIQGGVGAGNFARAGGEGRYQWWETAADAFVDEPLTGVGAGDYEFYWNQHGSIPAVISDAHSVYLETAAELGLGGVLLLGGFLAATLLAAIARLGTALQGEAAVLLAILAAAMFSAGIDWTRELPAVFAPLVIAAALLTGPATVIPKRPALRAVGAVGAPAREAPVVTQERFGLGVAVLLFGVASFWGAAVLFLSEAKMADSEAALSRGDHDEAIDHAEAAADIEPWDASPYVQLAEIHAASGNLAAARSDLDEALERSPEDWELWLRVARIEVARSDTRAALLATERGRLLSPRNAEAGMIPPLSEVREETREAGR